MLSEEKKCWERIMMLGFPLQKLQYVLDARDTDISIKAGACPGIIFFLSVLER